MYEKDGEKYEYYIAMDKNTLNRYDDNAGKKPHVTQKAIGTEVIFTQIQQFSKEEIVEKIRAEFFWFLELNKKKDYQIIIDGEMLTYEDYVIDRISFVPDVKLKYEYEITIVQWN